MDTNHWIHPHIRCLVFIQLLQAKFVNNQKIESDNSKASVIIYNDTGSK